MTNCPDLSLLVDMEAVTGYHARDVVSHVARCPDCTGLLGDLETVHREAAPAPVDERTITAVVDVLEREWGEPAVRFPSPRILSATLFGLSFVTILAMLFFASSAIGATPSPVLAGLVASIVGAVTARQLSRPSVLNQS